MVNAPKSCEKVREKCAKYAKEKKLQKCKKMVKKCKMRMQCKNGMKICIALHYCDKHFSLFFLHHICIALPFLALHGVLYSREQRLYNINIGSLSREFQVHFHP
jgi:hypothetical protein